MAASLPERTYNEAMGALSFSVGDAYVTVFPDKVWMYGVTDPKEAEEVMGKLDRMLAGPPEARRG